MPDILTMNDDEFLKEFDNLPIEAPVDVVETPPVEGSVVVEETLPPEVPVAVETGAKGPAADPVVVPDPVEPPAVDYMAGYNQIIGKTFKAGGKEITVNTPEEAIQLMQMGVGFHQKMSKLSHAERIIETLKENDLLSEEKINELVDISKKNPEAIAALVQSAGLEPHQLLFQGDAQTYTPGNHVLPEAQLQFRNSVDSIRDNGGTDFLAHVAQDWDVTSRAEVYKDPRALDMMYDHKQSGIYDKISSEVERRKMFDPSVAKAPFIHAYLTIGNEMHDKGLLAPQQEKTVAPVVQVPVAIKPAVASQPVAPNPAAARAASVRSTPTPATTTPNYLTMSDEEFKKHHMTPS